MEPSGIDPWDAAHLGDGLEPIRLANCGLCVSTGASPTDPGTPCPPPPRATPPDPGRTRPLRFSRPPTASQGSVFSWSARSGGLQGDGPRRGSRGGRGPPSACFPPRAAAPPPPHLAQAALACLWDPVRPKAAVPSASDAVPSTQPLGTTSSDGDPKAAPSPGDRAASRAYGCRVSVRPAMVSTTHPVGPATSLPGAAGQTPGPVLQDCGFAKSPPPWSSCAGIRRRISKIPWNVCPGHCHSIFLAGLWSLRALPGQRQRGEARPGRPVSAPGAEEGSSFLLSVFKNSIYLLL